MTINAVPVTTGPPGVLVTVTASAAITSIQLYRLVGAAATLTRGQPSAGSSTVAVADYDVPWGVPVTYRATYTAGSSFTETTTTITVPATGGWMIHPIFPTLSVQITGTSTWVMSAASVTRVANATSHTVIGSRFPVVTTVGPRQAGALTMNLATGSPAAEAAMWALLDDQTPMLIRFPDSLGANFDAGYYSVGDVKADRVGTVAEPTRLFSLPLTRVAPITVAPVLSWDYPTIRSTFADYPALTAQFADYASLTADKTT